MRSPKCWSGFPCISTGAVRNSAVAVEPRGRRHLHFRRSQQLFERARQVIPGGIYGHATPALVVPGASPYYAHRAEGARYWDVDGNEFIDLMCAYGPVVLGYRHPAWRRLRSGRLRSATASTTPLR